MPFFESNAAHLKASSHIDENDPRHHAHADEQD